MKIVESKNLNPIFTKAQDNQDTEQKMIQLVCRGSISASLAFDAIDSYKKNEDEEMIKKISENINEILNFVNQHKNEKLNQLKRIKHGIENKIFMIERILQQDIDSLKICGYSKDGIERISKSIDSASLIKVNNFHEKILELINYYKSQSKKYTKSYCQSHNIINDLESAFKFLSENKIKIFILTIPYEHTNQQDRVRTIISDAFYQKTPIQMTINKKTDERVDSLMANLKPYSIFIIQKIMKWFSVTTEEFIKPSDIITKCENELLHLRNIILTIEDLCI